jgi:hypothetical protein
MSGTDITNSLVNVGDMAATGASIGGPIGAAVGGAVGIVSEFIKGGQAYDEAKRQLALQKQAEISKAADLYYQKMAKGGIVKGPGDGTSDSVKTTLNSGDMVIPKKYAKLAKQIRDKYLGGTGIAQGGGDVPVAVSNGEMVFTAEEAEKLLAIGIDLNNLTE